MGDIFSGIGGSAKKTDRKYQLQSWSDLQSLFRPTVTAGLAQAGEGTKNLSTAGNYFQALASGDPAKMSKVLAPQISGIQQQVGQGVGALNQFAGRSGGTAAAAQQEGFAAQQAIQNLFDLLGPEAAGELAKIGGLQQELGQGEIGIGASADEAVAAEAGGARSTDIAQSNATGSAALEAGLALFGL